MGFLFSQMCCCRVWSWKEKAVTRHGKFCSCQTLHFMKKRQKQKKKTCHEGQLTPTEKKRSLVLCLVCSSRKCDFSLFCFFLQSHVRRSHDWRFCRVRRSHDCKFCHARCSHDWKFVTFDPRTIAIFVTHWDLRRGECIESSDKMFTLRPTTRWMHRVFRQDVCIESYDPANA